MWKHVREWVMKYSLMSLLSVFVVLTAMSVMVQRYLSSVGQKTPELGSKAAISCKVTVPVNVMLVDAFVAPHNVVVPGDTVCIAAGDRTGRLEIKNFRGAVGKPILFINSGGKVRIDAQRDWTGVYLKNNEYIRFTGSGDSRYPYGFEIYNASNTGINASTKTRYVEIDHTEIHNTGGAGISAKSSDIADANGNGTMRDEWTQYNTFIHHNWLYDIGTEGFYIGGSFWQNGIEPELEGVELSYNKIERTGWDGLQVGSATKNVKVHHNTIVDAGLSDNTNSGNGRTGMIVNPGTTGDFYNNIVRNARSDGIYIQGIGGYRFYNNLVDNSGVAGSARGIRWALGNNGLFYNNTIVNTHGDGMTVGSWINGGSIFDNLIAGATGAILEAGNIQSTNNLQFPDISPAKFVNAVGGDFRLQSSSPAVDKGSASGFAPFDLDDISRPQGTRADIGAYEYGGAVVPSTTPVVVSPTRTPSPTQTRTPTPSRIPSSTRTPTPTFSPIGGGPTATRTPTPTPTRTPSPTPTRTPSPTRTRTPTPTLTPTRTPSPTPTRTPTPTTPAIGGGPTATRTATPTRTLTPSPSSGPSASPTPSRTPTPPSVAASPTPLPTWTTGERYQLLVGDVNDSNTITIEDVSAVLAKYTDFSVPVPPNTPEDVNADGAITIEDVALVLLNYIDFTVRGEGP